MVVGFEGFDRRRDAAQDEAAGFGRGDAEQGGVAAAVALQQFGFAEFCRERFGGSQRFLLEQLEDS